MNKTQVYRERTTLAPSEDSSSISTTNKSSHDTASYGAPATISTAVKRNEGYSEHATSKPSIDTSSTNHTSSSEDATTNPIVSTDVSDKMSSGTY